MADPPAFRERLAWDLARGELRDGDVRYLLIRADTLMGLFRALPEPERGAALEALARSVVEHGRRSAQRYQAMGAAGARALLEVIERTAPQLGWGVWRFNEISERTLALEVENSPFAAGHGPAATPVCHAIAGMLQAVGSLALGGEVRVEEERCAAQGHGRCVFRALGTRATPSS
jgi:predicted hydrocarbon binding protein